MPSALVLGVFCSLTLPVIVLRAEDTCTTPNGEAATCIPISKCTIMLEAIQTRNNEAIEFAKQSQCGYENGALVCCGTDAYPKAAAIEPQTSLLLPNITTSDTTEANLTEVSEDVTENLCTTPNNESATCIPISSCIIMLEAIQTRNTEAIEFAKQSQCGYENEALVCCGTEAYPKDAVIEPEISVRFPSIRNTGSSKANGLVRGSSCITPNSESASCIGITKCDVIRNALVTQTKEVIDFAKESQCGYDRQPLVCCGTKSTKSKNSCTTPNGERATCTTLSSCRIIREAIKTRRNEALEFAKQSQCGYNREPLVCCGTEAYPRMATIAPPTSPLVPNKKPGGSCTTPNNERAQCIAIDRCPILFNAVTSTAANTRRFLQASQCGYNKKPYVCCGSQAGYRKTTNILPDRQTCGFQATERILGGTQTDYAEFPWLALLEYKQNTGGLAFSCGGALISNRYVLTAAHCIIGKVIETVGELISVRLGEWDTSQGQDCSVVHGFRDCNDPPVDVKVEEFVTHPNYNDASRSKYNDIGLLRLERAVQFTQFIRPICLPNLSDRASVGDRLFVAGWGRTEYASNSTIKLKVALPVVGSAQCAATFRTAKVTIADTQLCAGGERNKDSCNGDSGGPLMHETTTDSNQWVVEGIVSFGTRCGTHNWPGIYTRVSLYVKWIQDNVFP